ncbi:MAG TPA: GGDEF domain-containing protein [Mariprofundaceae bacterium]|nr:GGDEF domain-containing protein [Mariprofundaceae bacterium]
MRELLPDTPESMVDGSGGRWARLLNRFFPNYSGEIVELVGQDRKTMIFDRQRAGFILSRTRLMASLFAVLTPLWIPLDIMAFPHDIWAKLASSRVLVCLAFMVLAAYCRRAATLRQAYLALGVLFFVPSVFFLFSNSLLWDLSLDRASATLASGYAFLTFLLVAGLGIFPLTLTELSVLALPLLGVAAAPVVEKHLYMMPFFNALAMLWLLILVAGVGCLASVSQLQLLRKLFHKAVVDPLTGALNRESGVELIAMQFALAQRNHYPLALAFVDLDDFKHINDTQGHDAGDGILVQVAQSWRSSLRKSDVVMRWGGDEFILLLPYTNRSQARHVIDDSIRGLRGADDSLPTFSVGIAENSEDHVEHWRSLVTLADQRMYQAKSGGKNRTVAGEDGVVEASRP